MFIRRLKSKNGKVYIQVVTKKSGQYKVLKSFGGSRNESEVNHLVNEAQKWISDYTGDQEIDFSNDNDLIKKLFDSITQRKTDTTGTKGLENLKSR
jgi:hypothetical protein